MPDELNVETKLIQQMVTKVYELVTMEPTENAREKVPQAEEAAGRFKESNTKVHLCVPGIPLYPKDFENMYSLGNPSGLRSKTALFSVLVDSIPAANANRYEQTPRRVSNAFQAIVQAANSHGKQMSGETEKMLSKINKFLFCEVKEEVAPNPFADEEEQPTFRTGSDKTDVYKRYEDLIQKINAARNDILKVANKASEIADWRNDKDYSDEELERIGKDPQKMNRLADRALRRSEDYWEANSFDPQKKYERLKREFDGDANMKYVKQALDFQVTHGNELTAALLANCKKLAGLGNFSDQVLKIPIKLSLPSSTEFAKKDSDEGYSNIRCNTKEFKKAQHKVDVSADLGLKGVIKLVAFGVKAGGSTKIETMDTNFKNMSVDFDVCSVNIIRPWMDATLFSEYIDWDAGRDQPPGSVSSGKIKDQTDNHLLPFIPMQMIVAKNVKLKADWTKEHKDFIEQAARGGFSIGWGPFKIGPSMKESSSHLKSDEESGENYLDCKGIQCIGFVSWVPPFCAPKDGTKSSNPRRLVDNLPKGEDEKIREDAIKLEEQFSFPPDLREARYQ
jgi:hypothetical protein